MRLPAELRLNIYEYVFCDNEPDEVPIVDDTPDTTTEKGAPAEIAAQEKSSTKKKQPRQINLLDAKKHYPYPALLATCKLISNEAEPVFEAATKMFWDIEIFNVTIASRPLGTSMCIRDYPENAAQLSALRKQLESMSLLKRHGIKGLRFSWTSQCITINKKGNGRLASLRSGPQSGADVDERVLYVAESMIDRVITGRDFSREIAGGYPSSAKVFSASRMLSHFFVKCM